MNKKALSILLFIIIFIIGVFYTTENIVQENLDFKDLPAPTSFNQSTPTSAKNIILPSETSAEKVKVIATNLDIPWDLDFLPSGAILIAERPGNIRYIDPSGNLNPDPIYKINDVFHFGEGGLLGLAIHPNFESNHFIYFYYTYRSSLSVINKVVRYKYENGTFTTDKTIIDGIPGAVRHNGGRIDFGPNGNLYITTGDANNTSNSQKVDVLAGKILRVNDNGDIPNDNPFGNAIYTYGHRNPQGLAWDERGRLWATEHGNSAHDELNLIEKGNNYGWPEIQGDETRTGMQTPILNSGNDTWAPSGATYLNNSIYFTGLRGSTLYRATPVNIDKDQFKNELKLNKYFYHEYGRLRTVVKGPDNLLYILTSNRDGRGSPTSDDDRLLRVNPEKL